MKRTLAYLLSAGLAIVGSLAAYAAEQAGQAASEQAPNFMFVQSGGSVTYSGEELRLKNASPTTVFFTDRPKRAAGHMPTDAFLNHWKTGANSFQNDPPNATLSVFGSDGNVSQAVIELTSPRMESQDLVYNAKVLEGNIPSQGGEASLFIDSSDGGCGVEDTQFSGEPCWAQEAFQKPRDRL